MENEQRICVKKTFGKVISFLKSIDAFWWIVLLICITMEGISYLENRDCLRDNPEWVCKEVREID